MVSAEADSPHTVGPAVLHRQKDGQGTTCAISIMVHFEKFRNISVPEQGMYSLRTRVRYNRESHSTSKHVASSAVSIPASSEQYFSRPGKKTSTARGVHVAGSDAFSSPARLINEGKAFQSRSFLIRYIEEVVELNDAVIFCIEVPVFEVEQVTPVVEVDLMWSGLEEDNDGNVVGLRKNDVPECVARTRIRLLRAWSGIHQYTPILFSESYFCQLDVMIHTVVHSAKSQGQKTARTTGSSNDVRLQMLQRRADDVEVDDTGYLTVICESFAKRLFSEQYNTNTPGFFTSPKQEFLAIGTNYLQSCTNAMRKSHDSLRQILDTIVNQYLDFHMRESAEHLLDLPPLVQENSWERGILTPTPAAVAIAVQHQLNTISNEITVAWYQFIELALMCPRDMCTYLRSFWKRNAIKILNRNIFREVLPPVQFRVLSDFSGPDVHERTANEIRNSPRRNTDENVRLWDENIFGKSSSFPILFPTSYTENVLKPEVKELRVGIDEPDEFVQHIHVVVLQHGYQGKPRDMSLFRNMMALNFPKFRYLLAESNMSSTELSFKIMGENLAAELLEFLKKNCVGKIQLGKLSFVGHSIGSLIIRAALTSPLLLPYLDKLHSFVSLSSPHLGFYFAPGIVNTAVWIFKRMMKSTALEELSFTDAPKVEDSALYRLAADSSALRQFSHVLLFSSHQDNYSPYHSSRIEQCRAGARGKDSASGVMFQRMLNHLHDNLRPENTLRVDVSHAEKHGIISTAIGRQAHIRFIDSFQLTFMIVHSYAYICQQHVPPKCLQRWANMR